MGRLVASHITGLKEIDTEVVIAEGQEPNEFWMALGGRTPYSSGKAFEVSTTPTKAVIGPGPARSRGT